MISSDIKEPQVSRWLSDTDDGGANKSSNRLYRRKARRLLGLLTAFTFLLLSFLFLHNHSLQSHYSSSHQSFEKTGENKEKQDIRWVDPR